MAGDPCNEAPTTHHPPPKIYPPSKLLEFHEGLWAFLNRPVIWFRENIVEPNRKEYAWYHQEFPRVRTIDDCYTDEYDCIYEADMQYKRDKSVDSMILNILRYRMDDCVREEFPDHLPRCMQLKEDYETAAANWFSKYGDLGAMHKVNYAFMKQKHRLLWERRHGPVGCGMKKDPYAVEPDEH